MQTPMTQIPTTPITPTQLAVPAGIYSGLAWLDQGLVLQARTANNPVENLYWIDQQGNLGESLSIPLEQAFVMTSYYFPQRLPNGKLGLRRYNWNPNLETGISEREFGVWQFDPTTNDLTPLLQPALPQDLSQHLRFSLAPDMQRAMLSDGGYLQSRLFWWSAEAGHQPLDAGVAICQYFAWSPDGTTIAYAGSPHAADSMATLGGVRSTLYLMDSDGGNRREIGTNIRNVSGLQWSPDGQWLVVLGYFDGFDNQVWLVNPTKAEWHQLTTTVGNYQWPAWSPDGKQIAVIWRKPADLGPSDYVMTLDVSAFMQ